MLCLFDFCCDGMLKLNGTGDCETLNLLFGLVVPILEVDRKVFYCGMLFVPEISGSGAWPHIGVG